MEKQTKGKWIWRMLSYLLVAALASTLTLLLFCRTTKLEQLQSIIEKYFVADADMTEAEDAAAYAMVDALGDRWSYYIPADQYQSYLEGKSNSYVGIGITISQREDGTGFDILQVEPEGPAQIAGILPGDILIEADGQPLAGRDVEYPSSIIKGQAGTQVAVTVLRAGERMTFAVTRQVIETQVAEYKMLPDQVGYIQIKNFNTNCAQHTIAAIDTLIAQGATCLVFDARNNPGGYVSEMVQILDYLLPEGLLFQSVSYSGEKTEEFSDSHCIDLPMAVLVNGNSYSAAEFFAAALEEYDWAVIAGDPTSGKSYYQNTFTLKDGSAVGLSTGQYFTPQGVSLTEVGGLVPEVLIEVDAETAALIYGQLLEPEKDPQLQGAIAAIIPKNP